MGFKSNINLGDKHWLVLVDFPGIFYYHKVKLTNQAGIMQRWQVYILNLALALTFFAMAAKAFVSPDEINEVIENSLIFKDLLEKVPVSLIGIHDTAIGILIILRVWPKLVTAWAAIWIGTVVILLVSSMNMAGFLDALEHAAVFGIALYLSFKAFTSQKEE